MTENNTYELKLISDSQGFLIGDKNNNVNSSSLSFLSISSFVKIKSDIEKNVLAIVTEKISVSIISDLLLTMVNTIANNIYITYATKKTHLCILISFYPQINITDIISNPLYLIIILTFL